MRYLAKHPIGQLDKAESLIILPPVLFVSLGWLYAATTNLASRSWWTGQTVGVWLDDHQDSALPIIQPLITSVLEPLAIPLSVLVALAQLLVGLGLASGTRFRLAVVGGLGLSGCYIAMGSVNPSGLFIISQLFLLGGLKLGYFGPTPRSPRRETLLACVIGAATTAPFITTAHPAALIHDPAFVLAGVCLVIALAELTLLSAAGQVVLPSWFVALAPYQFALTVVNREMPGHAHTDPYGSKDPTQQELAFTSRSPLPAPRHPWQPDTWQNPDDCTVDHHWAVAPPHLDHTAEHPYGNQPASPKQVGPAAWPEPDKDTTPSAHEPFAGVNQMVSRRFQPTEQYWYAPECRNTRRT